MSEFRSFAFTIRPQQGVPENGDLEKSVIIYLSKYRGFLVSEKEGHERHLHGQVFFEKAKRKFDVNKQLNLICQRTVPDWNIEQQRVLHKGTKICYNDDWFLNYTNKECESELLYSDMPQGASMEYYPSQEEQMKAQSRTNAVDKVFHYLYELYEEDPPAKETDDPSPENVRYWLYDNMFIKKKLKVIEDKRKFNQRAQALYHYIVGQKYAYSQF